MDGTSVNILCACGMHLPSQRTMQPLSWSLGRPPSEALRQECSHRQIEAAVVIDRIVGDPLALAAPAHKFVLCDPIVPRSEDCRISWLVRRFQLKRRDPPLRSPPVSGVLQLSVGAGDWCRTLDLLERLYPTCPQSAIIVRMSVGGRRDGLL